MGSPYDAIRDKLPTPKGEQRKVLALDHKGHNVILGTAGSGKTTMAILRALSLSDKRTLHAGPTLLVTYNKALVQFLRSVVTDEGNLEVRTFHHFARGYLNHRGHAMDKAIVQGDERRSFIEESLDDVRKERGEAVLRREVSFFDAEMEWIGRHGVTTAGEYEVVERVGRKQALASNQRAAVWAVREAYEAKRREAGYRHDWEDLATAVKREFAQDPTERHYLHIIVDEAQDFSLEMLRSLVAALRPGGSLTLFGDSAQQIYGRGVSWRSAGIKVQKVWEFARNYRYSRPIVELAKGIADMPYFDDVEDLVQPSDEVDEGPTPALVSFSSAQDEWSWIVQRAREYGKLTPASSCKRARRSPDGMNRSSARGRSTEYKPCSTPIVRAGSELSTGRTTSRVRSSAASVAPV